jgi:hypothetical protein
MLPHYIESQLVVRAFWLGIQHPELTKQEARNLAAEQLAAELAAQQAKQGKPRAASAHGTPSKHNAGRLLLSKIAGMIDRLARQGSATATPPEPGIMPEPVAEPARSFSERLGDRVIAWVSGEQPPAKPAQPEPQYPLVRAEGSSAVLISDDEYPAHLRDPTTENWRKSIADNLIRFDDRRGTPPARKSWLIG